MTMYWRNLVPIVPVLSAVPPIQNIIASGDGPRTPVLLWLSIMSTLERRVILGNICYRSSSSSLIRAIPHLTLLAN